LTERKHTLAEDGPRIEDFLDLVLDLADFDLDFEVTEGETLHPDFENPDLLVRFSGPDVELLLANKAELMLALEQLTMEALRMPADEHSRLCFDANDHRMLRIQELRMSAQAAAERVKKTGVPFHFSPMNSRERRILHLAMRNETEVRSESVGEGPIRQVVIVPKDLKTLPEPIRPPRPRPETPGRSGDRDGGRGRDRRDGRRGGFGGRGRDRGRR
jgi:spoIIIJ-associated protein